MTICANAQSRADSEAGTAAMNQQNRMAQQAMAQQIESQRLAALIKQQQDDFIPRDPWRVLDGVTNYIKSSGVEFCGKVVDITENGVRIEGEYGKLFSTSYNPTYLDYSDFFVANYPFEAVNDTVILPNEHLMAWYVGTYTYSTVNGGSRTIKKLDYGTPCGPAPEFIEQQIEAANAKAIRDKMKTEQLQINTVHFLQDEATNGSASAQYNLGLHYLSGQGCDPNRDQAIFWLQKSASQGNLEASNKLVSLQKSETP